MRFTRVLQHCATIRKITVYGIVVFFSSWNCPGIHQIFLGLGNYKILSLLNYFALPLRSMYFAGALVAK